MQHGACDRNILELLTLLGGSQQEPTPAHIAPAYKLPGKQKTFAKYGGQHLDVFRAGHAAKKYEIRARLESLVQAAGVAFKRAPIPNVIRVDIHFSESPKIIKCDRFVGREQAPVGSDYQRTRYSGRRTRKRSCIAHLAAKIEPAQETEYVSKRRLPARLKTTSELEVPAAAEEQPCSLSATVRRGE